MSRTMQCPHCKATLKLWRDGDELVAEVAEAPATPKAKETDLMDLLDPKETDDDKEA